MELRSESLEDVILLSKYKFDRSHLVAVKWTLKRRKVLVGSIEKPSVEGFKESKLSDISCLDVAQVGIETSTLIVGMALAGKSPTEEMAKEIAWLKQYAAQVQARLVENAKNMSEDKQRSLDELKIALEPKYEHEK